MTNEIFDIYGNDPIALCKTWLAEAEESELNDPEAVCLATADKEGHPSARMVLLKEISARGFKFHTNADSHKGQDIRGNPYAALCLYWKSTRKQIRIEGRVEQAGEDEADEYFATRSIERKIGAWASKQSTPFAHRAEMEEAVKKYEAEFAGADHIPRPPYWKGYRVIPVHIEFWIAHEARLHTRFAYTRPASTAPWNATWLCP
ncbi:MAG: pyridoxamine 5'-phosphate oxidase [Alphaproteobacteria bacterium]|nr:pyridoxamine 5'-phosphate oxidase [Alphaproteobacteria bacterium]